MGWKAVLEDAWPVNTRRAVCPAPPGFTWQYPPWSLKNASPDSVDVPVPKVMLPPPGVSGNVPSVEKAVFERDSVPPATSRSARWLYPWCGMSSRASRTSTPPPGST